MRWPGVELTTSWLQGQRLNHNTSEWYMFNQFRSGAWRHQCWRISRSEGNDHVSRLQDLPVVSATARQYTVAGHYWNDHDILLQAYWLSSQVWWFVSSLAHDFDIWCSLVVCHPVMPQQRGSMTDLQQGWNDAYFHKSTCKTRQLMLHIFKHCGTLFSCCWPLTCPVNRK